jgi:phosphoglycerate dehydrogenase-like enzyme
MGSEVAGKTLGLVGCGRIGQVVAALARGLGMRVIGYDPLAQAAVEAAGASTSSPSSGSVGAVTYTSLADIWKKSDFISLHTPLNEETVNLVNDQTLALCKRGVRIVNCARGGIIDEAALLRALQSGRVAGAALDV